MSFTPDCLKAKVRQKHLHWNLWHLPWASLAVQHKVQEVNGYIQSKLVVCMQI